MSWITVLSGLGKKPGGRAHPQRAVHKRRLQSLPWKRHTGECGSRQLGEGGTGVGWGTVGDEQIPKEVLLYLNKSFREMCVRNILWGLHSMLTQGSSREVST